MKELTESIIKDFFLKTGVDEKYFSYYETELKRCHNAFREEYPYDENEDDEERAEDEKMEKACIECANDYIRYYVEEREKGHSHKWSDSVSRARVSGEHEFNVYYDAYSSIENDVERERELRIRAKSLFPDSFAQDRYIFLFKEQVVNPQKDTEEYLQCISGKN